MASDHSDLGFVQDSVPTHRDIGFVEDMPTPDKGAMAQAALEHFGDAAALGYLPHLQAVVEKITPNPTSDVDQKLKDQGFNVQQNEPSYVAARDQNISRIKDEAKQYPKSSLLGAILGSVSGGAALSGAIPVNAPTLTGRLLQAGKVGAAVGAASNPGDIEGEVDPIQANQRAKDAVMGAAISAPLQLVGEGVGKVGGAIADKLSDIAEKRAFKAIGPYQRNVLQNSEDINSIGRTALDEGVIGKIPRSYETIAERAAAGKKVAADQLENVVQDLASKEGVPTLSRDDIVYGLEKQMVDPRVAGSEAKNSRIQKLIDEFQVNNPPEMLLSEARSLKKATGNAIRWDRLPGTDIPVTEEVQRGLYGQLKGGEEAIAEALAKEGKIPNADQFLNAKEKYGNLSKIEKIASTRSDKNFANQFLGLGDTIAGGTGAGVGAYLGHHAGGYEGAKVGAMLGGAIGTAASKFSKAYGNQIAAKAADSVSSILSNSPGFAAIVSRNPAVIPMLIENEIKNQQQESPTIEPSRGIGGAIERRLNKGR